MRASYAPLKRLAMRMICGIIKQNCKGFGNLELEGSRPNPFPFSWPICVGTPADLLWNTQSRNRYQHVSALL
jgi:hypothetical protein